MFTHTFAYLNTNEPAVDPQGKRVFLHRMQPSKGLSTHLVKIPDICNLKKRSVAWMVFIAPWIKRCEYLVTFNTAGRQAFGALLVYEACANEKRHELFTAVTCSTRQRPWKTMSLGFSFWSPVVCLLFTEATSRQHCLEKYINCGKEVKWKQLLF